jgi:hypothetical protein
MDNREEGVSYKGLKGDVVVWEPRKGLDVANDADPNDIGVVDAVAVADENFEVGWDLA